ncbi:polyhomeotic-like protein 3 isoform X2 [Esox lucius]|uniref:polyhomeotic-like protein 3 isoform X2 n=1 Tax=Esox lucius TaxID=8010 RepID=UPI001476E383|nr:polyhomeotic-like protein 3 isoform X2 [Esox lucius]
MMDRQSLEATAEGGEIKGNAETATVTSNTTSVTMVTTNNATASVVFAMMTTASSTTPPQRQAPPSSPADTDRQAVQVIQQAIHSRPQTMASQYLQQMYAAQQQHIRQQQQPHSNRQSPSSPPGNGTVTQSAGTSITLPIPSGTGQLIGHSQSSSSTTGTINQQAMLLGNGSASCNQAQMYLRTQMLILTPAANVTAVHSDRPSVCCSSSQPSTSQSLAMQPHLPGALTTAQSVLLKPSFTQTLVSQPKMSICSLRPSQQCETSTDTSVADTRPADVTRQTSANQHVTPGVCGSISIPASYSPVQSHAVVRHQLSCPLSHKGAPQQAHQLIIQQTTAGSHRQLHPISLHLATHNAPPSPFPLTLHALATPTQTTSTTVQSQPGNGLLVPSSSWDHPALAPLPPQQSVVVSSSSVPPPLLCSSLLQPQIHRQPQLQPPTLRLGPISQASLPMMLQPPPPSLQRLSLSSVQALAVQSTGVLVSEEEMPVTDAVVQMPFQNLHPPRTFQSLSQTFQNLPQTFHNLSPPQTVAVDLKVQPASLQTQPLKERKNEKREEKTPASPTLPSSSGSNTLSKEILPVSTGNCTGRLGSSCVPPSNRSVIHSSSQGLSSHTSSSPPPLLSAAAVRSPGQPPSASATPPGSPERARPPVLTHLIEGFVVREALQPFLPVPFPMGCSSLGADQSATLPGAWEDKTNGDPMPDLRTSGDKVPAIRTNEDSAPESQMNDGQGSEVRIVGDPGPDESLMDAGQPDSSSDSDMDDTPTQDEPASESPVDVLQCEFCGKKGYVHTFLRSRRFCSMICVRRFNVSRRKRLSASKVDKANRWGHRPVGRRGRPPGRVNRGTREHFLLRQVHGPYRPEENKRRLRGERKEEDEDELPVPMITRLRRQEERERRERERMQEKEREQGGQRKDVFSSPGEQTAEKEFGENPTQWSVEQVCAYINSLPGGRDISEEFRSQDIDGQALLLLTEEHLMTAMHIKLGPALKVCAHINSLKKT